MQSQTPVEDLTQRTIEKFWESFPYVWHTIRTRVDKMAAAASHFMEDETGEAMVGLKNGRFTGLG